MIKSCNFIATICIALLYLENSYSSFKDLFTCYLTCSALYIPLLWYEVLGTSGSASPWSSLRLEAVLFILESPKLAKCLAQGRHSVKMERMNEWGEGAAKCREWRRDPSTLSMCCRFSQWPCLSETCSHAESSTPEGHCSHFLLPWVWPSQMTFCFTVSQSPSEPALWLGGKSCSMHN